MSSYMFQGFGSEHACKTLADAFLEADEPIGCAGVSAFEQAPPKWRVEAYYEIAPSEKALEEFVKETLKTDAKSLEWKLITMKDEDWVAKGLEDLPPVTAGRYVIYGAHDAHKVPQNAIGLHIEASSAFGTGHHHTTKGCLLALEKVLNTKKPADICNVLDIGAGTGVLGFAALKTCPHARAVLSDTDVDSVRISQENAVFNRVKNRSTLLIAAGTNHIQIQKAAPFDLIFANILAPVLCAIAGDIAKVSHSGTVVILSGLLNWQARWVQGAFTNRGFVHTSKVVIDDWTTLVLTKN